MFSIVETLKKFLTSLLGHYITAYTYHISHIKTLQQIECHDCAFCHENMDPLLTKK